MMKTGREEIVGLYWAVKEYLEADEDARLAWADDAVAEICGALAGSRIFAAERDPYSEAGQPIAPGQAAAARRDRRAAGARPPARAEPAGGLRQRLPRRGNGGADVHGARGGADRDRSAAALRARPGPRRAAPLASIRMKTLADQIMLVLREEGLATSFGDRD